MTTFIAGTANIYFKDTACQPAVKTSPILPRHSPSSSWALRPPEGAVLPAGGQNEIFAGTWVYRPAKPTGWLTTGLGIDLEPGQSEKPCGRQHHRVGREDPNHNITSSWCRQCVVWKEGWFAKRNLQTILQIWKNQQNKQSKFPRDFTGSGEKPANKPLKNSIAGWSLIKDRVCSILTGTGLTSLPFPDWIYCSKSVDHTEGDAKVAAVALTYR